MTSKYESKKYRVLYPNGAQCRKGKELSSKKIAIIPRETIVIVEEIDNNRCRISSPEQGWISRKTHDNYTIIVQVIKMTQIQQIIMTQNITNNMFFVGQQITCTDTRYHSEDKKLYHDGYIDKVQNHRVFVVFTNYENPSQGDWISKSEWRSRIKIKPVPINDKSNKQSIINEMPSINMTSNIIVTNKHISMWSEKDVISWIFSLNAVCVDNGGLGNQKQHIIKRIKKKKITGKELMKCTETKHLLPLFGKNVITESTAGLLMMELAKEMLKYEEIITPMTQNSLITDNTSATTTPITPLQINKSIDEWTGQDLQEWISSIGLSAMTEQKIIEIIDSDGVTGKDFNCVETASDLVDSFECIDHNIANKIFMELLKYRQNAHLSETEKQPANIMPAPPSLTPLVAVKSQSLDTFQIQNQIIKNKNGFDQSTNIRRNSHQSMRQNNNYYNSQQKRISAPSTFLQPQLQLRMSETDDHYAYATIDENSSASVSTIARGRCSKIGCNCNSFSPNTFSKNKCVNCHHDATQHLNHSGNYNPHSIDSFPAQSLQQLDINIMDDGFVGIQPIPSPIASPIDINMTDDGFVGIQPIPPIASPIPPKQQPHSMQMWSKNVKSQSYNSMNRNQYNQPRQIQNPPLKNRYPYVQQNARQYYRPQPHKYANGYNNNKIIIPTRHQRNRSNTSQIQSNSTIPSVGVTSPRRSSTPNKKLPTLMKRMVTEKKIKLQWNIGDRCEIYSDSSKTWCPGKIENIETDDQGKCYKVAYSKNGITGFYKNIPVNLENINEKLRTLSKHINQSIIVGKNLKNNWNVEDQCDVYSSSSQKWFYGKVVYVSGTSLVAVEYFDGSGNKKNKTVYQNDRNMIRRPKNARQNANKFSQKVHQLEEKQDDMKQSVNELNAKIENILPQLKFQIKQYIEYERKNRENTLRNELQKHINTIEKNESKRIFYHSFVTKISMAFFDAELIKTKLVETNMSFDNKYADAAAKTFGLVVKVFQEVPLVATILDLTNVAMNKAYSMLVLENAAKNKIKFKNGFAAFNPTEFAQNIAVVILNSECVMKEIAQYKCEKSDKQKSKMKEIAKKYSKYLITLIATGEAKKVVDKLNYKNKKNTYIDILSMGILMQSNNKINNAKQMKFFNARELNSNVTNDVVALIQEIWNDFGTNTFWSKFTKNTIDKINKFKT